MPFYRCGMKAQIDDSNPYVVTVNGVPSERVTLSYGLAEQSDFNSPFTIGNKVVACDYMLKNCTNFNQPVTFGDNIENVAGCFSGCSNFNSDVNLGSNIKNISYLFDGCTNFNRPIIIGNVLSAMYAFKNTKFNQPITLNVDGSCMNIFMDSPINSPVIFGPNTNYLYASFSGCVNFASDIYVKSRVFNTMNYMFNNTNYSLRKNLWINSAISSNVQSARLTGGGALSWTTMTNGFYNALTNIYVFNNYAG